MLKIAFIGAGRMARLHLGALRRVRVPHRVVGVHDVSPPAAADLAAAAGAVAYRTSAELLAAGRPDIVHVCTPAGAHFEPALRALEAGAHVYVEKPFVETEAEARALLDAAGRHGVLVCAGHQLVRDPAYERLLRGASALAPVAQVDSTFNFRPPGTRVEAAGAATLAAQLLDILPHPLYTLIAALEGAGADPGDLRLVSVRARPYDVHALLESGAAVGRLAVSLVARPIASTLTVTGAGGSLTTDFVRAIVVGAGNAGTEPLEKVLNPLVEARQLATRSVAAVLRRVVAGGDYPGLVELITALYDAVRQGRPSPLSPAHLLRVTAIYEELAANVRGAVAGAARPTARRCTVEPTAPLAVVTGARGWLGRAIARDLARRGHRVRGVSRSPDHADPVVDEWVRADLGVEVPREVLRGASVVVHAAAETSGGYDAHQRNSIDATRNLLRAMREEGVRRLVYVSSLSVIRPPRTPWEVQSEATPLAADARPLGAYAWGKCEAEKVVWGDAARLGIEVRVVRPGALVDWARPDVPGLVGRRLFGRWHLGFGRPGHPIAVCAVERAGAVVAWCAAQFDAAPGVVNLWDDAVRTRTELFERFRHAGWRGRMIWVPIGLFAAVVAVARTGMALLHGRLPDRLSVWSILRPRRYDASRAALVLQAAALEVPAAPAAVLT